jgi:uncharacterized membrane protein YqhA
VLRRLFSFTPFMIFIAVAGSLLSALTLVIYGFLVVIHLIYNLISDGVLDHERASHLSIQFIEIIDIFLIGVILLIVGLGLYQLFIDDDEEIDLPAWLIVRNLDQLKHKLIGVICVLLGVTFLTHAENWAGEQDILYYGAGIALVLLALVALLFAVDRSIKFELQEMDDHHHRRRAGSLKGSAPEGEAVPPPPAPSDQPQS